MCFEKFLNNYKAEIASEDKSCIKILIKDEDGTLISPVLAFPYEIGVTYECKDVPLEELENKRILEGGVFYSYSNFTSSSLIAVRDYNRRCISQNEPEKCWFVAACSIPEGTPYWFNPFNHLYASTKIRINNLVDLENLPFTE